MKNKGILLGGLLLLISACGMIFLTPLGDSAAWHFNQLFMKAFYTIKPPEEEVFIPNTPVAAPTSTPTQLPTETPTAAPSLETAEPTETVLPTEIPTPLPGSFSLDGVKYIDQHGLWNYCAPANLAMSLTYWGWDGDRVDVGSLLKPFEKDKNVMPYEMENYVRQQTSLGVMVRHGGSLELLKKLISNGFPVLIEKGAWMVDLTNKTSWMGHFAVVDGYDDSRQVFLTKDSYYGPPDYPETFLVNYTDLEHQWRGFNFLFMVIYPYYEEIRLLEILGDYADNNLSNQIALDTANEEISSLDEADLAFAWFNKGTSLVQQQDYAGAAAAYDEYFSQYSALPSNQRPWRMVWYQTGPYYAYYFAGRYQDVIDLATSTLDVPEPFLEESWYWRARAYVAIGQRENAIEDLKKSLEYHPNFPPSVGLLQELGVSF